MTRRRRETSMRAPALYDIGPILPLTPPEWMARALCAHYPPETWFPDPGQRSAPAKLICRDCPVAGDCLAYALANDEPWGTWGGLTAGERRAMRGDSRPCAECGAMFSQTVVGRGTGRIRYCGPVCLARGGRRRKRIWDQAHRDGAA